MFERQLVTLHDAVADRFGEALRSVAWYDGDAFDFQFLRDDVAVQYDERDYDRVFRTLRLEALDRPNLDSLYAHGDLRCTCRVFAGATVLHVATSETTGVLVSVDAGTIADLRAVTGVLTDELDVQRESSSTAQAEAGEREQHSSSRDDPISDEDGTGSDST